MAQTVKIRLPCRRPGFDPWVGKVPWRRAWQPTPVFLPGESHGQRSLVGSRSWGRRESDTTEWLSTAPGDAARRRVSPLSSSDPCSRRPGHVCSPQAHLCAPSLVSFCFSRPSNNTSLTESLNSAFKSAWGLFSYLALIWWSAPTQLSLFRGHG